MEIDDVEPVIEILTEIFSLDFPQKIFICGADDSDINGNTLCPVDSGDGAFLNDSEQCDLLLQGHIADLV